MQQPDGRIWCAQHLRQFGTALQRVPQMQLQLMSSVIHATQVEHPVTEMISGVNLPACQVRASLQ